MILIISLSSCLFASSLPVHAQSPIISSLHLENADLRTVLSAIAKSNNLNLVLDNSISGSVSLHLENIQAADALKIISTASGYSWQQTPQSIIIGKNILGSTNLTNLAIIKLKYLDAKTCKTMLQPLVGEGVFSIDPVNNYLIFSGCQTAQENLNKILQTLDIPSKQISLEVTIIAINKEEAQTLGFKWFWSGLPATANSADDTASTINLPGKLRLSKNQNFNYQSILDAQINSGNAKILANPKIMTIPGYEGKIFIGDHIPVVTEKNTNGTVTQSTEYVDAGIKLSYIAYLNANDYITATLHTEVSTPTLIADLKNYKISTRQADTTVRLKNGETLIIGGLIGQEDLSKFTKIPFLSDIPFFGNLFKHQEQHKQTTEIVIFLTPKLVH